MKWLFPLLLLTACDEVVNVRNQTPAAELTSYCTSPDGRIYLDLQLTDHEGDPVDIDLVAEVGGQRVVLGPGAGGDGTVGLSSDREGTPHRFEWGAACAGESCVDACADRPVGPSGLTACAVAPTPPPGELAVTVYANDGAGESVASSTQTLEPCP